MNKVLCDRPLSSRHGYSHVPTLQYQSGSSQYRRPVEHVQRSKEETFMSKNGLQALLTPKDSVLLLIDHQPFQFANLHSHEPTMMVNNVIGLAKTAKVFGLPTVLTTVMEQRGGFLIKGLQDVFPDQKPINRTFINAWEDG